MRRRCRPSCAGTCAIPSCCSQLQAAVYGLYHMTEPEAFYNREDLWAVATEGGLERAARAERAADGAELRADEAAGRAGARVHRDPAVHAGEPQQPDWLDRRPQRRAALRQGDRLQLSRRRGSSTARCRSRRASIRTRSSRASCRCGTSRDRRCVRGGLIVIPVGRALLYAEPIYLQAERSPMPELRIVVLALQDRLAYGPTFEAALAALFGQAPSTLASTRTYGRDVTSRAPSAAARAGGTGRATGTAVGRRECADPGRRARSRGLPAAHGRRKARRGGPEARSAEAEARALNSDAAEARLRTLRTRAICASASCPLCPLW